MKFAFNKTRLIVQWYQNSKELIPNCVAFPLSASSTSEEHVWYECHNWK